MGLQINNFVRVQWISKGAKDTMGSEWVKVFEFEDLPELITVPDHIGASTVRAYIEGRYGYQVRSWAYWSAVQEASRFADNLYSGDPL